MGGGFVNAPQPHGVTMWEWIEEVEPGYVVWRLQLDGVHEQLCMYDDGQIELRSYSYDGEEDCWRKIDVT